MVVAGGQCTWRTLPQGFEAQEIRVQTRSGVRERAHTASQFPALRLPPAQHPS